MNFHLSILFTMFFFVESAFGTDSLGGFENYRYNPFQFPFPEYFKTPDTITVAEKPLTDSGDFKRIEFFGLSASVRNNSFDTIIDESGRGGSINYYIKKNKQKKFFLYNNKETLMGCSDTSLANLEKDYCSSFSSSQDFFLKLFTLTPNHLITEKYQARGYSWIVHQKGRWFKGIKKIRLYQGTKFYAFRRDFSDTSYNLKGTELNIFHLKIAPDWITLGVVTTDETFILQFLSSLRER